MRDKKNRVIKLLFKYSAILLSASLLYLLLGMLIIPPITLTQLTDLFSSRGLHKHYVSWDNISPNIKLAAIASEDQRFLEHGGIDWESIDKSMHQKPRKKKKQRMKGAGASTISQQTAKNVFLWQGSGWGRYVRKVPEFMYTKLIEWVWGKRRIMEVYLNVIEMGPGIYGVEAAAQRYFHKSAKNLSQQEAAMIIACLPNPKKFTVVPLSRRVAWRTPQIVRQMGFLAPDEDIIEFLK